ncbi:MAG: hypothetical protein AB8B48_02850 [Pseudomonadales bacterium]
MLAKRFIVVLLMLIGSALTHAFNDQQAWEEWLEVGGKRFPLYNYTNRKGQPRGSVLLILSAADGQARAFKNLAASLPDHGWNAVAVVIDHDVDDDSDFEKRVNATMGKLPELAGKPLVVLSSGQYAQKSAQRFAEGGFTKTTSAFVALNRPAMNDVKQLRRFHQQNLAVLDISTPALSSNRLRQQRNRLARELGQKHYRYMVMPPVSVSRVNSPDALSKRILSWLNTSYSAG